MSLKTKTVIIELGERSLTEEVILGNLERLSQEGKGGYQFVRFKSFMEEFHPDYNYSAAELAERTPTDMVRDAHAVVWMPHTPNVVDWFARLVREGYSGQRILAIDMDFHRGFYRHATSLADAITGEGLSDQIYQALSRADLTK